MTPHRILLVDDHRDVSRLLHSALDSLEHELYVIEAPSGEEALLETSRHKIDLLVADYRLPGMTGLELMGKVAARNPDAKVILITGLKDKKARQAILDAGAFAFFEKPVSLTDFLDAVERALDLKRTILPSEDDEDESEHHKTMAGLLSNFRQNMDAQVIFLASDRGRILVRAGALADSSLEVSLLSALMAIYSAGQKVSRFIHQETPSSYHIFQGGDQDVLLFPVNAAHALIVAGDRIAERKKILELIDAMMILKSEVEHVLTQMGVAQPIFEEETDYEEGEELLEDQIVDEIVTAELEDLFKQKKKIKPDEAESFWEDAVDNQIALPLDANKLSYEQAQQLGLTPEDKV